MNILVASIMNSMKAIKFGDGFKVPIYSLKRCLHLSAPSCNSSHYEVLQIPQNATQTEIKDAYYKLSKVYHPDVVKKDEISLTMFQKITEAYDVLGNVRTRLEYDNKALGKYTPYDTSKQQFYASIYRDQVLHGIRKPDTANVIEKKSPIDHYLKSEYKDRLADFKLYGKKLADPFEQPETYGGVFGEQRLTFIFYIAMLYGGFKFYENQDGW